jgi:hypothetical protein
MWLLIWSLYQPYNIQFLGLNIWRKGGVISFLKTWYFLQDWAYLRIHVRYWRSLQYKLIQVFIYTRMILRTKTIVDFAIIATRCLRARSQEFYVRNSDDGRRKMEQKEIIFLIWNMSSF